MYDFYLIIVAIINAINYRNNKSPVLQASKFINLTVAMVAMISLEVAMISKFGDEPSLKMTMTGVLGFVVCLINFLMSLYMIINASKNMKKTAKN